MGEGLVVEVVEVLAGGLAVLVGTGLMTAGDREAPHDQVRLRLRVSVCVRVVYVTCMCVRMCVYVLLCGRLAGCDSGWVEGRGGNGRGGAVRRGYTRTYAWLCVFVCACVCVFVREGTNKCAHLCVCLCGRQGRISHTRHTEHTFTQNV